VYWTLVLFYARPVNCSRPMMKHLASGLSDNREAARP